MIKVRPCWPHACAGGMGGQPYASAALASTANEAGGESTILSRPSPAVVPIHCQVRRNPNVTVVEKQSARTTRTVVWTGGLPNCSCQIMPRNTEHGRVDRSQLGGQHSRLREGGSAGDATRFFCWDTTFATAVTACLFNCRCGRGERTINRPADVDVVNFDRICTKCRPEAVVRGIGEYCCRTDMNGDHLPSTELQ